MVTPLAGTEFANKERIGLERVRYTHDAMIDMMIARPGVSQIELAKCFGYTVAWISRVVNSDSFQKRLAERRTELVDPELVEAFEERLLAAAETSLAIVQEELDTMVNLPAGNALRRDFGMKALELTGKALGFGARPRDPVPPIQNTFVVALPQKVEDEQKWVENAAGRRAIPTAVDVQVKEVQNG